VCAKYKRKFGCKLVFDAHEMYDHLAQSEEGMSNINKKTMLKYSEDVDLFVTINDSIANYYKQNYPGFPKAIVVKNATNLADEIEYDGRLHEAAGLPRERKILLYQGGFANKRGLIQLLMSAEYLDPSWTIVFMGWGSLRNDMKRVTDALIMKTPELSERIKFVPKVKQKELVYWTSGAILGVIPYENTSLNHWFCTPNKLWEYPNAGVPIIASPFPEMEKVIVQNSIGWFLPDPLTPEEIANAINSLDDNELLQTRTNCRKFISQDNWSKYAQRLQECYGELS
jgi:glycosyltransferase involved in cell wall biosynthesis